MTEEIVRELVDGVWQTRLADASAGGGVPDPSAAPDGDVITVASGAYVLAPGGGSSADPWAITTPLALVGEPDAVGASGAGIICALWLDASDAATIHEDDNPGFVSTWDDKSGNGSDATQTDAAKQPATGADTINGLNTLTFNARPDFMESEVAADTGAQTAWTICSVQKGGAAGNPFVYSEIANQNTYLYYDSLTNLWHFLGDGHATEINRPDTDADVVVIAQGVFLPESAIGSAGSGRRNRDALVVGDSEGPIAGLRIGAQNASGPNVKPWNGQIAELIVFAGALSDLQQRQVIDYLTAKWLTA